VDAATGDTLFARDARSAESVLGRRAGERMTVRDLLRALLLASANDAAATLASGVAGSEDAFVAMMNRRAQQLGLADTAYDNPIGLDAPGNHSSARDLATLTLRLRRNAFFRSTVARAHATLESGDHTRTVSNRNDLVGRVSGVDGVKTGHTLGAGYVLVGSATRRGATVVSVVLGDPSQSARDADTTALLDYGLAQFAPVALVRPRQAFASAAIRYKRDAHVRLIAARPLTRVLRRGEHAALAVSAPRRLEGPIDAGAAVGSVTVRVRGRVVARVPLVTARRVPKVTRWERAVDLARRRSRVVAIAAVVLIGLLFALTAALRRRRSTAAVS
jgi:D-alanyl-D-alanine carboxypeptidase (penicillin-binding protein 5/6)